MAWGVLWGPLMFSSPSPEASPPLGIVIDDDPVCRMILRSALEKLGMEVREAARGSEASALLEEVQPQLVIIDGLLPDTDGVAWLQKERRRLPRSVVFASSFWNDLKSYRMLTGTLGVGVVMQKPLQPKVLLEQLATLLKRDGVLTPQASAPAARRVSHS